MKFCISCGKQINTEHQICPYCGTKQPPLPNGVLAAQASAVPVLQQNIANGRTTLKEYAIEQRRFNEKVFGRGTRSIDSVEGLLNKYAREGWRLHTMMTSPTRDEKTQLTTMVFERDILG